MTVCSARLFPTALCALFVRYESMRRGPFHSSILVVRVRLHYNV
jgi:hypothetical protein